MTLLHPGFFQLGLLAAGVVAFGYMRHARRRRRLGDFLGGVRGAGRLSPKSLYRAEHERILFLAVTAICLGLSASEPRQELGADPTSPFPATTTVVLALDISASMQGSDVTPTRLARAVEIAEEFLDREAGGAVGLTLFAGKGYLIAPPTQDLAALSFLLNGIVSTTSSAQDPGSLLSAGIRHASALLHEATGSGAGTLVLLSDGESGEAEEDVIAAVLEATAGGTKVHTVGIGTAGGAEISTPGTRGPLPQRSGSPGVTRLQEPLLRQMAQAGGGLYASGSNAGALRRIYRAVEPPLGGASRAPLVAGADLTLVLIGFSLLLVAVDGVAEAWPRFGRLLRRRRDWTA